MTAAYSEIYLDDAMTCLGEALDYVSNACQMDTELFMDMFIAGGYASRFEEGESSIVSGLSGTELARRVMYECGLEIAFPSALMELESISQEYQSGMLLAYLQWYSERKFADLVRLVPPGIAHRHLSEFASGNEDEKKKLCDALLENENGPARIQSMRKARGLSQKQLADAAGVNVRTLQQYEIRSKDINKAAVKSVLDIARTIGCTVEDIMEYGHE